MNNKNYRLIGLDMFRVFLMMLIFFFHTSIHLGCTFGIFTPFVKMGAIAMSGFFMLSGFSIYYSNSDKNYNLNSNVKQFYFKRAISILPLYYVTAVLYIFFLGKESIIQNISLIPIESLGLQSVFSSLFKITHNGGTWFISCIIFCYLMFPLLLNHIKQMSFKQKNIFYVIICLILIYSPFIVSIFRINNTYSNPFFRLLEFILGCLLASTYKNFKKCKILTNKITLLIEIISLVLLITVGYKLKMQINNYMFYSIITIPIFSLILFNLSINKWGILTKSILLKYLCNISYSFFLVQFFVWPIMKLLPAIINNNNFLKIVISLIICILLSIISYEFIEKLIKKYLYNKLLKKNK